MFWVVLDLVFWLLPSCVICRLTWHIFLSNRIAIYWLYILSVCISVFNSFLFFGKQFDVVHVFQVLIFSCDLMSLYPAVHFLMMWVSVIMAITKTNGNSASPSNMPLFIFISAKLFPPTVNSTFQVCMFFSINCTTWRGIDPTKSYSLYFSRQCIIHLCPYIINLFVVTLGIS